MDLYFTEGGDLTDREVLVQAAADCGLDADRVRAACSPATHDVERVERAAKSAKEAGIDGVPCFILGGVARGVRRAVARASRRRRSNAPRRSRRPSPPNRLSQPRTRGADRTFSAYRATSAARERAAPALAAIHEPRMRTPMRCQSRVRRVVHCNDDRQRNDQRAEARAEQRHGRRREARSPCGRRIEARRPRRRRRASQPTVAAADGQRNKQRRAPPQQRAEPRPPAFGRLPSAIAAEPDNQCRDEDRARARRYRSVCWPMNSPSASSRQQRARAPGADAAVRRQNPVDACDR